MTARSWIGSALGALVLTGCSGGGSFPNKPILLVCPWAAGGGSDRVARLAGALLERELKVQVNVVNATGGEGVTGHSQGAGATADGHTLTLMTSEITMLHWRGLTRLTWRDFDPVLLLNRDAAAVFVRSDSPWDSLKDLEKRVREGPTPLRASGTGSGGIWHLALGGWLAKIGLAPSAITWVSFAGANPSLQEMKGGGLDLVCCSLPEARAMMDGGSVRCLGVMAAERHPAFPDVPTFRENGADWTMGAWRGIGAPRGTPKAALDVLVPALRRVAEGEEFRKAMATAGHGFAAEEPEAYARTLRESDAFMGSFLTRPEFRTMTEGRVGPLVFPSAVALALLVGLAMLALSGGLKGGPPAPFAARRLAEGVLWVVVYMALSGPLGFVLTSAGLLLALMLRLGVRPRSAALTVVLLVPSVYHLFSTVLRVPLPRGLLGW
jgi:tripartite-type tricarboxylate transporter receptor subunit TctC